MQIAEVEKDGVYVLALSGDIDLNESPRLRDILRKKIDAKCSALLIDFTEVNYIDSSGLATLVEYYQGSRKYSGKIVLANMTQRVKSVFDLVRLGEIFSIMETVEQGILHLKD